VDKHQNDISVIVCMPRKDRKVSVEIAKPVHHEEHTLRGLSNASRIALIGSICRSYACKKYIDEEISGKQVSYYSAMATKRHIK
jgi:hypothetical protein